MSCSRTAHESHTAWCSAVCHENHQNELEWLWIVNVIDVQKQASKHVMIFLMILTNSILH